MGIALAPVCARTFVNLFSDHLDRMGLFRHIHIDEDGCAYLDEDLVFDPDYPDDHKNLIVFAEGIGIDQRDVEERLEQAGFFEAAS
jgi:hypothetical protein